MTLQITQQHNRFCIAGDVGFSNVERCLADLRKAVQTQSCTQIEINFAQIKHLDGSIIALMISLLRHLNGLGIKVTYTDVPAHILRISELYGVRNILPIVAWSRESNF